MCGIAGWINWKDDLTQQGPLIARMGATLSHRGPDAQGQWLAQHAALAHRRLIVLDPEGGGQPMVYQDGERSTPLPTMGKSTTFRRYVAH